MNKKYKVSISIVSHDNIDEVYSLIRPIIHDEDIQIILTINTNEKIDIISKLKYPNIIVIKNKKPLGFSTNHNNALKKSCSDFILILNPDVQGLVTETINLLIQSMSNKKISIISPLALSITGERQDNARLFPSIYTPFLRKLGLGKKLDYEYIQDIMTVDWISGMFMLIKAELWKKLSGFDERFFMYYEDVDFCKRAKIIGYSTYLKTNASVIHDGRRKSKKNLKLLFNHIQSYIIYHLKHGFF